MTPTPSPFYDKNADANPQTKNPIARVRALVRIGDLQWPGRVFGAIRAHAHSLGAAEYFADRVAR